MGQGTWGMPDEDIAMADDWCRQKEREDNIRLRELQRERRLREKETKAKIRAEVERQLKLYGIEPKKYEFKCKMVDRICKCGCGSAFQAREADVKRGWGRFSSKSCAARFKDKVNNGIYRGQYGT